MQQSPSLERVCNGSLRIIRNLRELQFSKLLDVYSGSLYSSCSTQKQLEAEQDFYAFLREFFKSGFYAVWELNGRYVSALRLEPYQDGLLLEAVETAPAQRNQGYAKRLLNSALAYVTEYQSCPVYSHVKKDNDPSLALHRACGFQKILDYASYIDGSVARDARTFVFDRQRSDSDDTVV